MLKTLRVTSLVTAILAVIGVITVAVLGLKGDPQVKEFLAKPGIVDELRKKAGQEGTQEEKSSPLVAMAQAFALRIDPPPPPKSPDPGPIKPRKELVRNPKPVIPQPKGSISAKFDLLATVVYEADPERSLALLKTAANKQEWFRQGEKAGHLELQEIRDGSVVFTQGGGKSQEKFVPAKPQTKSLLKSEQAVSTIGPRSITTQLPGVDAASRADAVASETMDSGKVRMTRPIDRTSRPRPDVSSRIQRVRSLPAQPSPQEEKASINKILSKAEEIMNSQNELLEGEEREKENKMWQNLLRELNTEKKRLETEIEHEKLSEKDAGNSKTEQPKENSEKKPQDANNSVPAEPNKPG